MSLVAAVCITTARVLERHAASGVRAPGRLRGRGGVRGRLQELLRASALLCGAVSGASPSEASAGGRPEERTKEIIEPTLPHVCFETTVVHTFS